MSELAVRCEGKRVRRVYSGAFKAQVVREALNGKCDLPELARRYDLHPNQIKNWKCILCKRMAEIFEDRRLHGKTGVSSGLIATPCDQ